MSLLAEPRRKQIISVDPNNKNWTQDKGKYGFKMLERMGWSQGKGLGANQQGMTDPIKPKANTDARGLGSQHNSDDNWLTHQDNFSALLASLNKDKPAGSNDTVGSAKKGLEATSKQSRSRIHYQKFTRGKDVSAYSQKHMGELLGKSKREKRKAEKQEERRTMATGNSASCPGSLMMTSALGFNRSPPSSTAASAMDNDDEIPPPLKTKKSDADEGEQQNEEKKKNDERMLSTSTVSATDYYSSKMAEKLKSLKAKNLRAPMFTSAASVPQSTSPPPLSDEQQKEAETGLPEKVLKIVTSEEPKDVSAENSVEDREVSKKKKSKKKKRKLLEEEEEKEEACEKIQETESPPSAVAEEEEPAAPKKKSKKKKKSRKEEDSA